MCVLEFHVMRALEESRESHLCVADSTHTRLPRRLSDHSIAHYQAIVTVSQAFDFNSDLVSVNVSAGAFRLTR